MLLSVGTFSVHKSSLRRDIARRGVARNKLNWNPHCCVHCLAVSRKLPYIHLFSLTFCLLYLLLHILPDQKVLVIESTIHYLLMKQWEIFDIEKHVTGSFKKWRVCDLEVNKKRSITLSYPKKPLWTHRFLFV